MSYKKSNYPNPLCSVCTRGNACPHTGNIISSVVNGNMSIRHCEQILPKFLVKENFIPVEHIGEGIKIMPLEMFPLKITELEIIKNFPTINP